MRVDQIHTFEADRRQTAELRFVDAGATLITGGGDGCLRWWDTTHWIRRFEIDAHDGGIASVSLDREGRTLVSAGRDKVVRVWALPERQARYALQRRTVGRIAPDGRHLVTVNRNGRLSLHAVSTGETVLRLASLNHGAGPVTWTPGSSALLLGGDRTIARVHPYSGQVLARHDGHRGSVQAIGFAPDGRRFASVGGAGVLAVWSLDGRLLRRIETGGATPGAVAISPDGELAAISLAYQVQLRRLDDGVLRARIKCGIKGMRGLDWSPDGTRLACAAADGKVRVWRLDRPPLTPLSSSGPADDGAG